MYVYLINGEILIVLNEEEKANRDLLSIHVRSQR